MTKSSDFVHRENIKHFENKLEIETNPAKRELLVKLLADERLKTVPGRLGREPLRKSFPE